MPTIGVADLQAPLNNMLRSSSELLIMIKTTFSQPYIEREPLIIKINYCVCELLPLCLFVRMLHASRPICEVFVGCR